MALGRITAPMVSRKGAKIFKSFGLICIAAL
jgi:hypothetical protein